MEMSIEQMVQLLVYSYMLLCMHQLVSCLKILGVAELNPFIGAENAFDQAENFYRLSVNTTAGYADIDMCGSGGHNFSSCVKYGGEYDRSVSDLWAQPNMSTGRDCQYSVRYAGVNTVDSPQIIFSFRIYQHHCIFNTTMRGGARFQSFLNSSDAIGSCSTVDLFDNNYIVFCTLPTVSTTIVSSLQPLCVDLTVNLVSEHLEQIHGEQPATYAHRQSMLLHRKNYCTHSTNHIADSKTSLTRALHVVSRIRYNVPKNVRWYCGQWVRPATDSARGALILAHKYTLEPVLYTAGSENMVKQLDGTGWTTQHCLHNGFNHNYCNLTSTQNHIATSVTKVKVSTKKHTHQVGSLHELQYLRNISADGKHQFHFLGGAQMQKYFDTVNAYYMGENEPHHTGAEIVFGNVHYKSTPTARQLSEYLPELCKNLQNRIIHGDSVRHTIIVETGQENLANASLHSVLYGPSSVSKVIRAFESIFNHTMLCGGLTRILYITTPPCAITSRNSVNSETPAGHNTVRGVYGYCRDSAVKALNEYMTSNMLRVSETAYHMYKSHGTRSTHTTQRGHRRKLAHSGPAPNQREGGRNSPGNNAHKNKPDSAAGVRINGAVDNILASSNAKNVRTIFPINLAPVQLSVIDSYTVLQPLLYYEEQVLHTVAVQAMQKLILATLSIDRQFPIIK